VTESKNFAFFKGNFVPIEDAKVSIMNHAFMYGTAVFEGIRGYWNEKHQQMYVFRLEDHFERLRDSMKIMHMSSSLSVNELSKIVVELLVRNAPKTDTYVRPCAYADSLRIGPSIEQMPTDISIFTAPFGNYYHSKGLNVCISSWRRVEDNAIPARGKITGAYANTALSKTDALLSGFDECIVLSESGHVSEGSAMNLFMVKKGKLYTPSTVENILEGITRATVVEMAEREFGIKAIARTIDRSELYTADELFFCGTGAQIAPIVTVDNRKIGDGEPGEISTKIEERYTAICRGDRPGYEKWLTPVYPIENFAPTPASVSLAL
jgi:branched-chain amino acid aminotransferase